MLQETSPFPSTDNNRIERDSGKAATDGALTGTVHPQRCVRGRHETSRGHCPDGFSADQHDAEKIFCFFLQIVDDASYRAWHPHDHVTFRWIKGEPWQKGSVVYAEEYIHGKLHKLRFLVSEVVPYRKIEFVPASRFLRIYFPGNSFMIEPQENSCVLTASVRFRVGWLVKALARRKLEYAISCVKKHMKQEGENLRRILESDASHNQAFEATS